MNISPLSKKKLKEYLSVSNLITGEDNHAIKLLYMEIENMVREMHPNSKVLVYHLGPIVSVEDNYDKLLIPKDNISRSSTYTHYVTKRTILRTHTSAHIPSILDELKKKEDWDDVVIMLPGLVYRRDVTDKTHLGVCHQLDMWRVIKSEKGIITKKEWMKVIHGLTRLCSPTWKERIVDMPHPYTKSGIEVNVAKGDRDIEILESGLINEQVLINAGLDPKKHSGWAMGMGLDRLVMTRKDIPDIRYLRSDNQDISKQMDNLEKYHEVSRQPRIKRDMSYCVPDYYVEEDINEDIRNAMGDNKEMLESIEVLSETEYKDLPLVGRKRLGCKQDQKNVLVRITLRHLNKTLTKEEANLIYDDMYTKVNCGERGYSLH